MVIASSRVDQTGQPEGAAKARMQAEHHFREAELRAVDRDAEVAGQRQFQPAAQAVAVDDRTRRYVERGPAGR
jgi:hypothetical protein